MGVGYGKVILLGEHAVVYGRHAIAAPIPLTIKALVEDCDEGIHLLIPRWGVEYRLASNANERRSFERPAGVMLDQLGLSRRAMRIEVFPEVPRSMGLGGSAAMAVAIVRALDKHFKLELTDAQVNSLAFESEKVAHGSPSGLDNTLACYGKALVFRPGDPPLVEPLNIREPIPAVIGMTGYEGLTAKTVGRVREAWQQDKKLYERIFDQIDALTLRGIQAIQDNDLPTLGELMNICQGMLNALQVSTPELEKLCDIARENGALGAKLTGGGGGGSIVAICDGDTEPVVARFARRDSRRCPCGSEPSSMAREEVVSNVNEQLILVDDQDRELGFKSKGDCHAGTGVLHRAFSIFVFNGENELLLQQRSRRSCCGRTTGRTPAARIRAAASRWMKRYAAPRARARVRMPARSTYTSSSTSAEFGAVGAEHEFCWVYYGRYDGPVDVNVERDRRLAVHRRRCARARACGARPRRSRHGSRWNGCTSRPISSMVCLQARARTAGRSYVE